MSGSWRRGVLGGSLGELPRAEELERLGNLLRRAGDDEGVAGEDLEVAVGCGVRRLAAHDRDDRHAGKTFRGERAELLPGDVVVVVDWEPVDAEPGDLVHARQRLGD